MYTYIYIHIHPALYISIYLHIYIYIHTLPVAMIGGMVVRPAPEMKLTTPGGKTLAYVSMVQMCERQPTLGSFITIELPSKIAGNSVHAVSLNG